MRSATATSVSDRAVASSDVPDFPAKNIAGSNGVPIASPFLSDAFPSNLVRAACQISLTPVVPHCLPPPVEPDLHGREQACDALCARRSANPLIPPDDWQNNREQRLPGFPTRVNCASTHGHQTDVADPWTAASGLLALRPSNSYTATMAICGGSNDNDATNPKLLSANDRTVAACYRMDLTSSGIAGGWQNEDPLPTARVMPQMVQMPCVVPFATLLIGQRR